MLFFIKYQILLNLFCLLIRIYFGTERKTQKENAFYPNAICKHLTTVAAGNGVVVFGSKA